MKKKLALNFFNENNLKKYLFIIRKINLNK
jgi:hypothetical protein